MLRCYLWSCRRSYYEEIPKKHRVGWEVFSEHLHLEGCSLQEERWAVLATVRTPAVQVAGLVSAL